MWQRNRGDIRTDPKGPYTLLTILKFLNNFIFKSVVCMRGPMRQWSNDTCKREKGIYKRRGKSWYFSTFSGNFLQLFEQETQIFILDWDLYIQQSVLCLNITQIWFRECGPPPMFALSVLTYPIYFSWLFAVCFKLTLALTSGLSVPWPLETSYQSFSTETASASRTPLF